MTGKQFHQQIQTTRKYDTPADPDLTAPERLFGRFHTWFRLAMLRQVFVCSLRYRRHPFTAASWAPHSYAIIRAAEACGGRLHLRFAEGLESVHQPVVYAANHMRVLETFALPAMLLPFGMITMVVKQSLVDYPLFGAVMRAVRPIVVGRKDPRQDLKTVLNEGTRVLKEEGRAVVIFPQATREPTFRPRRFNSLGVKLARKADVPIVPIALKTDFYGIGRVVRDVGPVDPSKPIHVHVGDPMQVTGNGKAQHDAIVAFIAEKVRSWGGRVD